MTTTDITYCVPLATTLRLLQPWSEHLSLSSGKHCVLGTGDESRFEPVVGRARTAYQFQVYRVCRADVLTSWTRTLCTSDAVSERRSLVYLARGERWQYGAQVCCLMATWPAIAPFPIFATELAGSPAAMAQQQRRWRHLHDGRQPRNRRLRARYRLHCSVAYYRRRRMVSWQTISKQQEHAAQHEQERQNICSVGI